MGCAGSPDVGPTYLNYVAAGPKTTYRAAHEVVGDLGFAIEESGEAGGGAYRVRGLDQQGTGVVVTVLPDRPGSTKFAVYVEPRDRRSMEKQIIDRIRDRLR